MFPIFKWLVFRSLLWVFLMHGLLFQKGTILQQLIRKGQHYNTGLLVIHISHALHVKSSFTLNLTCPTYSFRNWKFLWCKTRSSALRSPTESPPRTARPSSNGPSSWPSGWPMPTPESGQKRTSKSVSCFALQHIINNWSKQQWLHFVSFLKALRGTLSYVTHRGALGFQRQGSGKTFFMNWVS